MRLRFSIMTRCLMLLLLTSGFGAMVYPQAKLLRTFGLDQSTGTISPALPSNSVSHIAISRSYLWIGTSKGLARSSNGGRTWESFGNASEFKSLGIFAISLRGDTVWTATGYTKDVDGTNVQTGSGYTYSLNNGSSWTSLPQTLDAQGDSIVHYGINTIRMLPVIVPEQNVTFDVALTDSAVWIASWASGLRRSTDRGLSWQRIVLPSRTMSSIAPTDTLTNLKIDPRLDNNYLAFSVFAETNQIIWAGTAGGLNKSTDGGQSWIKMTRSNQTEHILSDWVIAVNGQRLATGSRIWTTNWPAEGENQQYGVSYSDDGGRTWHTGLNGVKAYDFAFKDTVVYVATDEGLYRTADAGKTWEQSGTIIDQVRREQITSNRFLSVGVIGDTVYCGSDEGVVRTVDSPTQAFGRNWEILRSFRPVNQRGSTYAYPNPFSPKSEVVRMHYSTGGTAASVTIEVFDFGMNRVRTVVRDAPRSGDREQDDIWDGRDEGGKTVPNGVYFYRLSLTGSDPVWGKIMVLQ
jgi:photosystem II stability/assembly factor-like uncharacterized protein